MRVALTRRGDQEGFVAYTRFDSTKVGLEDAVAYL